ncbi:hypothetical protein [Magnetospirillum sulfuroxidans]|uniref:hypothetical protein n=1 Tax=Magnetospirillum sulfuroxidans TaxID=611300 RepID=UPI001B8A99F3|nr:hypothetical protein [Magnetospirillum sulfuroxidans]
MATRPAATAGPAKPVAAAAPVLAKTVQPKFGFEFQTNWTVRDPLNYVSRKVGINSFSEIPVFKATALAKGEGWALTNDGGDAEFVLDPIEEGDISRLRAVFRDMLAFIRDITTLSARGTSVPLWQMQNATTLGVLEKLDTSAGPPLANPQMTAGIKMSKLRHVMTELGNRQGDPTATDIQYRGDRLAVATVLKECSLAAGAQITGRSAEYKSLIALVVSYVVLSSLCQALSESIKQITSLMSRSNLGTAFTQTKEWDNLPSSPTGQQKFRNGMLKDVINSAKRAKRALHSDPSDIKEGLQLSFTGLWEQTRAGPTIGDVVDGLMQGRDVFAWTYGRQRMAVGGSSMGSMGMNKSAPNKTKDDLIIIEFRDFVTQIPLAQWAPWAESLARWVQHINTGHDTVFTAHVAAPLAPAVKSRIGTASPVKTAGMFAGALALHLLSPVMQFKPMNPLPPAGTGWVWAGGARLKLPAGRRL